MSRAQHGPQHANTALYANTECVSAVLDNAKVYKYIYLCSNILCIVVCLSAGTLSSVGLLLHFFVWECNSFAMTRQKLVQILLKYHHDKC